MIRPKRKVQQGEFWIARNNLARAQASRFYDKLDQTLGEMDFAPKVRELCAPLYSSGEAGRPPIDPVVYFKMLMVGFLENLPSERAIAARCGDSLMIRRFLNYDLDEDIVSAEVRKADEADTAGLAERACLAAAQVETIREITAEAGEKFIPKATSTFTADKGYYCVAELEVIQDFGIKTVISDPLSNRRVDKLNRAQRAVVRRARRTVKSGYGKALLRRRGMHIERSFAHVLDCGGMRRRHCAVKPTWTSDTKSPRRPIIFRNSCGIYSKWEPRNRRRRGFCGVFYACSWLV